MQIGKPKTQAAQISPNKRADPDAANWNIAALDTAKDILSLSPLEKDVILEMNKARSNPSKYAECYIRPRLGLYRGAHYCTPGAPILVTQEGPAAVHECITAMRGAAAVGLLVPMKGLWLAAKDHAADQGATGQTGHGGSDGSMPQTRIARHGTFSGSIQASGENIAYGFFTGREIICGLLIDDGVPDRGHRTNTMQKVFTQCAASCMAHPGYQIVCVIAFATGFVSNKT